MSIKNKLNRLKSHIVKEEKQAEKQDSSAKHLEEASDSVWEEHGMAVYRFEDQFCYVKETHYPLDFFHGTAMLGTFRNTVEAWNDSSLDHPLSAKGHLPENLFFFDTETTGLGGGAGNMIFLLGHARVMNDKVVVKQHLLPKPGNEVALYQSFLSEVNIKTLVTYNGKAFDWPQVKTRHTLLRNLLPELPAFGHFDLLHAAKRVWKNHLSSLRLSLVEKEILNIEREGDVPGYLAPVIYFHFAETQDPEVIKGVMKHNELDVLTLITLYQVISDLLMNAASEKDEHIQFELARWLESSGQSESAMNAFTALSEKNSARQFEAKLAIAKKLKKEKQNEKAAALWEEVFVKSSGSLRIDAAIELAKYYEHKEKDAGRALHYARGAMMEAKEIRVLAQEKKQKLLNELSKRKGRLERKISS
ncbi:ribonuclease H-like domain-containing protein [Metabacillus sp. GX 13764]|uniref:ribonuclease H-like domain-containing protein n=1 Tax=Metabacillus kandeliae TaxID=2900151 RepID=UPI001E46B2F5|nr:ribonuclease H-like domain-containing protein [Metabacillus kandeliae]MCD7033415.1 ribonuclease H-like domain-containing protein [Metabacillus kandeliae]